MAEKSVFPTLTGNGRIRALFRDGMDGGRIAEDGTYEELIAENGLFAALVAKQRLDTENGYAVK